VRCSPSRVCGSPPSPPALDRRSRRRHVHRGLGAARRGALQRELASTMKTRGMALATLNGSLI